MLRLKATVKHDGKVLKDTAQHAKDVLVRAGWKIIAIMQRDVSKHFEQGIGPSGPWPPLSSLTLEIAKGVAREKVASGQQKTARVRRTAASKPLLDTGRLRLSIVGPGEGVQEVSPTAIKLGTMLRYAHVQQYGATISVTPRMRAKLSHLIGRYFAGSKVVIPPRPFLWLSETAKTRIEQVAIKTIVGGGSP